MNPKSTTWKTLEVATLDGGDTVELRYAEFGKGRAKCRYWRMYRNGEQVGYASTPEDATVNWGRVKAGMIRDADGNYAQA